jgi:hypothetical protein
LAKFLHPYIPHDPACLSPLETLISPPPGCPNSSPKSNVAAAITELRGRDLHRFGTPDTILSPLVVTPCSASLLDPFSLPAGAPPAPYELAGVCRRPTAPSALIRRYRSRSSLPTTPS